MRGWLTALRIARREARRAKGRSALVVALIALPVCALAYAAVSYDTFQLSAEQQLARDLGTADAEVSWIFDGPGHQSVDGVAFGTGGPHGGRHPPATAAELREVGLPPGTRLVPRRTGRLEMRTATGRGEMHTEWVDLRDPIHQGRIELRDGRAPVADGEAAMTRRAADRMSAGIGDEIATADGDRHWTVVGIAEYPYRFRSMVLLPPADSPADAANWLLATPDPVTWDQVQQLNRHGIVVRSRELRLHPPPPSQVDSQVSSSGNDDTPAIAGGVLLGGLALLEVVLLAGPAFAVGARRRQRQLALVAASGGTPAQQRRIVLADGVVLGAIGAVVGIAIGVVAALAMVPLLEEHLLGRRAGGLGVFPLALAGVAALAVVTGVVAALVPAATAARQPVVVGLAGRRGVTGTRRPWLMLGLLATAGGAALAAVGAWQVDTSGVLAGLILGQLGLVLCTPALVGLVARLGRVLPLTPRIALRDTARNRAAAAPAISAVMAAVTGALALGIYLTAEEDRNSGHQAGLPTGHAAVDLRELSSPERTGVRRALAGALPGAQLHQVAAPACPDGSGGCDLRVPVAEQHRCPAEDLLDERIAETGSGILDELLSADEQRAARADPRCQEPRQGWSTHLGRSVVASDAELPALVGGDQDQLAAASDALARGGVVVADPDKVVDGHATLEITQPPDEQVRELRVPAYAMTSGAPVPFAIVSEGGLDRTGLTAQPRWLVAATAAVPTQAQQDALREELAGVHPELRAQLETGPRHESDPFLLVLTAVAGVVALAAAGIATGLAAADRRDDLATLGAVGASGRVRRTLAASQAGVIAGLGALLGTGAGLGSAYAVLAALNQAEADVWPMPAPPYQLTVPWPALALLLVAVPAVAMLGAGLLSRSRLPVERPVA